MLSKCPSTESVTERHQINDEIQVYKQTNSQHWIARFKLEKTWLAKSTKKKELDQAIIKAIQPHTEYKTREAYALRN